MIKTLYPVFRKWSEKGSVYIISDTHFEDADCRLMDPDWPEPEEYIAKIKGKLTKNDTLIHLGDVGDPIWLSKIPCYKVLIMGNHDSGRTVYERGYRKFEYDFPTLEDAQKALRNGDIDSFVSHADTGTVEGFADDHLFDEIYEGPLFISEKIVLSHEPICVTTGITGETVAFNIHGHDHSGEYYNDNYHLNCAANVVGYRLTNLNDIIKDGLVSDRNIKSVHRSIIDRATEKKQNQN